jgi:hypothetical protein
VRDSSRKRNLLVETDEYGITHRQILPYWVRKIVFLFADETVDRNCYSHMGITVVDESRGDIDRVIEGLKATFANLKKDN